MGRSMKQAGKRSVPAFVTPKFGEYPLAAIPNYFPIRLKAALLRLLFPNH